MGLLSGPVEPVLDELGRRTWRVEVKGGRQQPTSWLSANHRRHWKPEAALIASWRDSAGWAFRAARLPRLECVDVLVLLRFATWARRDPANYHPTAKPVVDGLVDAGVLDEDDWSRLVGPRLELGEPTGSGPMVAASVVVVVTDLGARRTRADVERATTSPQQRSPK